MSNHVFISYARDDASDFVRQLHDDLEKMGLNMWLDVEDIPKSANWALTIQRAIMTCRAFIFVITPGSYESKVCNLELQQVFEDGTPILPVYLKDVEQRPLLIRNLTYTDCREEDAIEAGFKALFDEISEIPAGDVTEESEIIVPGSVTSGAKSAKIYTDYEDVDYLAQAGLFGRDALKKQITGALSGENARVLLQAFGGVGKTALAAQISAEWIEEKSDNVLWLEIGASDSEAAFEALAHPFGASKAMASTVPDDKAKVLRELVRSGNIGLVVLDDCWNAQSLMAIQKGIPRNVPLLVTARQRYPLAPIIAIPDLPEKDALALLGKLAPTLVQDEDAAKALCKKLGYHAFAVEVAGRTMQAKDYTAKALLNHIENVSVLDLEVPLDYQKAGRENIAALIETTLNELPDEAKKVFIAWGAFFSPRITPELMMQYFIGKPEVTDEMIANARQQVPDVANMSDEELRKAYEQILEKQPIDSQPSEESLNLLQQYGLATRQHATQMQDGRPLQVAGYKLHDLGFEYAKAQNNNKARNRAVSACLNQIARHKEPSLENFAALDPDIDNFMGASSFAMSQDRYSEVECFALDLYCDGPFRFMYYRGYYSLSVILVTLASDAARQAGRRQNQGAHLGNLGIAYSSLGQYEQAVDYHSQALAIAEEIGDMRNQGAHLGNLGIAYNDLGQYEQAIDYLRQALDIQVEIGDKQGQGNQLGNLGIAYSSLGQYEQAIDYHQQSLAIAREIGDKRGEGAIIGNLGNAYRNLGQYEQAIDYYTQALAIAEEIGDVKGKSNRLGNLGNAYSSLGQYEQAIDYHSQALEISREIGDKRGEGNSLGNLGNAYDSLGQHEQAIDYYIQALAISREIGDRLNESNWLNNLGAAYHNLEDYDKAITYLEQALALYRELGNPHNVETAERNLEIARQKQAAQSKSDE